MIKTKNLYKVYAIKFLVENLDNTKTVDVELVEEKSIQLAIQKFHDTKPVYWCVDYEIIEVVQKKIIS